MLQWSLLVSRGQQLVFSACICLHFVQLKNAESANRRPLDHIDADENLTWPSSGKFWRYKECLFCGIFKSIYGHLFSKIMMSSHSPWIFWVFWTLRRRTSPHSVSFPHICAPTPPLQLSHTPSYSLKTSGLEYICTNLLLSHLSQFFCSCFLHFFSLIIGTMCHTDRRKVFSESYNSLYSNSLSAEAGMQGADECQCRVLPSTPLGLHCHR